MRSKIRLKGQLKTYLQWPIALVALLLVMNISLYAVSIKAGMIATVFVIIYTIIVVALYFRNKPVLTDELVSFATRYGLLQKDLLREFAVPYALMDNNGKILWMNNAFAEVVDKKRDYRKSLTTLFPSITKEKFPCKMAECTELVTFAQKDYRVEMRKVLVNELMSQNAFVEADEYDNYLIAVYLFDVTAINYYVRENQEQKMVAGLVYIDNYEEVMEEVEDVRISLLSALIERKINKYFVSMNGIVRKLEKDKFFVVLEQRHLQQIQEMKFSLLEEVKTVSIGNEMPVTLSIGMGMNGATYSKNYEYARTAIDLALGRGGDQAVIKNHEQIFYYGGKNKQIEKNTRVKARIKAHALKEIIESKDKVIIMGHKIGDVDSFGAAVGIYRAAKTFDKKAHIIVNEVTSSLRPLLDKFTDNPDYPEDMIITGNEAIELADNSTVLVVVDVNKPSFTECPELLSIVKTIVVLDHHRQSVEIIENAMLSYVEQYASSACEMVAEILQYISEDVKIRNVEADCLYAGIIIDTNNFMSKTGVRTFEAAAFLRRNGADVTRVRKMFRNDMAAYKARAEAVRHSEVYRDAYAISVCPSEKLTSPTVIGAQAANELLNIVGIKASFVLTEFNQAIYISARSIDEVNVQIIMEQLGGGGHTNIAGAQIEGSNIESVKEMVRRTLDKMIDEGAI